MFTCELCSQTRFNLADILVLTGGNIPQPVPFCTRVSARMKRTRGQCSSVNLRATCADLTLVEHDAPDGDLPLPAVDAAAVGMCPVRPAPPRPVGIAPAPICFAYYYSSRKAQGHFAYYKALHNKDTLHHRL